MSQLTQEKARAKYARLLTLYSLIDGLPAAAVNMDTWRSVTTKRVLAVMAAVVSDEKLLATARSSYRECGTCACALGWASAYPEFKAAGLRALSGGIGWDNKPMTIVDFQGSIGYDAGAAFFGISPNQAALLFCPTRFDQGAGGSEKTLFLKRLADLLHGLGCITPARHTELHGMLAKRNRAEGRA